MPNNRLLTGLLASSVIVGATALAQVTPETPSLIDESETVTEPADQGLTTETNSDASDIRDPRDRAAGRHGNRSCRCRTRFTRTR